jgi:hypothetical protein
VVKARSLIRGFCASIRTSTGRSLRRRLTAGQAHLLDADFGEDAGDLIVRYLGTQSELRLRRS